jgi:peptidoglycan/LPS O-acetylase OafA/YrhL
MSSTSAKIKIYNIQVLRAIAALAVAYFHTGFGDRQFVQFGSFGVGVFFVISGFIMSYICQTRPEHFLLRRVIRIIPLYWGMTLVVFSIAALAPGLVDRATANLDDLAKSLFFIPYRNPSGRVEPLLFLGWTLNYEMYFYLTIAVSLLLVPARYAVLLAAMFILAIPALIIASGCSSVPCGFYRSSIVVEFIYGIAIYHICMWISKRFIARTSIVWPAVLVISLIALIMLDGSWVDADGKRHAVLGAWTHWIEDFCLSVPALLVLSAVLCEQTKWSIDHKWCLLLGDASYVMYLLHPVVVRGLDRIVAKPFPVFGPGRTLFGLVICVALVIAGSVAIHLYAERPLTRFLRAHLEARRLRPRWI